MTSQKFYTVEKAQVDQTRGLVFGYAIVCKVDGEDYYDLQEENIPEDVALDAGLQFMQGARVAKEMHRPGTDHGQVLFAFPMLTDIAEALGIKVQKTGILVGMKPGPEVLAKFVSGEYTGFSIGGTATYEDV